MDDLATLTLDQLILRAEAQRDTADLSPAHADAALAECARITAEVERRGRDG